MANVYAVKSGNWSDTTVWNTSALPTSADDVFANGFTVTIDQNVTVLSIRTTAASPAVAGGGFICSTSNTINCTDSGIIPGSTTCLTINGGSGITTVVNSLVRNSSTTNTTNGILKSGICTLNITGNLQSLGSGTARYMLNIASSGVVNIVGNLLPAFTATCIIASAGTPTINIIGDINPNKVISSSENAVLLSATTTMNVTGNIYGGASNGWAINMSLSTLYVTGNVYGGNGTGANSAIYSTGNSYINIIGILSSSHTLGVFAYAVHNQGTTSRNLFSGPFICSENGVVPFLVWRMNYIKTLGSYFEFRDSSTDGAIYPPNTPAPSTRLISPDVVAPLPINVRKGIVYADGNFTGTLEVPAAGSVALGVPVDNTTGTAVLTPAAVWDYATSSITNASSIGARLKNCSTVDTTGEQLEALL